MLWRYTGLVCKKLIPIIEGIKQVHRSLCYDKLEYKTEYYKCYGKDTKANFFRNSKDR